jgi:hypothetical protein
MTDLLRAAVIKAISALPAEYLTADMLARLESVGIKTYDTYRGRLLGQFKGLFFFYAKDSTVTNEQDFTDTCAQLISDYMREAWLAGMAENGIAEEDMFPEWEQTIEEIASSEIDHLSEVMGYISELADGVRAAYDTDFKQGKQAEANALAALEMRADMWAARWNDTYSKAILETSGGKDRLMWVYGDTDHCATCAALNGIVATAAEWEESSYRPQQPPNDSLDCGGWRCQCYLEPTDKRRNLPKGYTVDDYVTERIK